MASQHYTHLNEDIPIKNEHVYEKLKNKNSRDNPSLSRSSRQNAMPRDSIEMSDGIYQTPNFDSPGNVSSGFSSHGNQYELPRRLQQQSNSHFHGNPDRHSGKVREPFRSVSELNHKTSSHLHSNEYSSIGSVSQMISNNKKRKSLPTGVHLNSNNNLIDKPPKLNESEFTVYGGTVQNSRSESVSLPATSRVTFNDNNNGRARRQLTEKLKKNLPTLIIVVVCVLVFLAVVAGVLGYFLGSQGKIL